MAMLLKILRQGGNTVLAKVAPPAGFGLAFVAVPIGIILTVKSYIGAIAEPAPMIFGVLGYLAMLVLFIIGAFVFDRLVLSK
jgi:hypothetical protein